jgi:1-pyrroline-5-carboxylate dehydrogenase
MAVEAERTLRFTAGNFYISDKPMGAIVERWPFGALRHSGTNDKAGYRGNLIRRLSARIVKENIVPARERKNPFVD